MTSRCLILPVACAVITVVAPRAQTPGIVVDGDFRDWSEVPVLQRDGGDAPQSAVDFGDIRILTTDRHLYLSVAMGRTVSLATLPGTFFVLVDRDGDPSTGQTLHELDGVDLSVECSPAPTSAGVAVRRFPPPSGKPATEPWSAVNFAYAPRHSGDRFELRLDQPAARVRVKLVFSSAGTVRDETPIMTIDGVAAAPPAAIAAGHGDTDPLARPPVTSFRAAVWNVAGMPPFTADEMARVIGAIDPDVLVLDELWSALTPAGILARLPAAAGRATRSRWSVVMGRGTGQRGGVAVRGPVELVQGVIPYPQEGLGHDATDYVRSADTGVGAALMRARLGARRLLVVPVDFTCCGAPESDAEALRILEADAINRAVRLAMRQDIDGVLIGGDFNLVGTRAPLDVAAWALDLDRSALTAVDALKLDGLSKDTWRQPGGGGRFPPGRLDWLLYSDTSLEVVRAFVLDTADLSQRWLDAHNLRAGDSAAISDHLPIVADFRWRK
jgi:endonuclease/exonuclease/phosphatase family metal-dependent hydrolase